VFKLIDVPDRDDVELHIGNTVERLQGLHPARARLRHVKERPESSSASKAAFLSFMADHPEQRFSLTVIDPLPEHHV
jgi:hypothetical protein